MEYYLYKNGNYFHCILIFQNQFYFKLYIHNYYKFFFNAERQKEGITA
jgi:hypothetical protein